MIEPTWLLCNGVDARGGLFGIEKDGVYLHGAVHPIDGETAPFEERHLRPDQSHLDPVWPPSKPRTADDEALVVDSVLVEVDPSPPPHPFRFYGYRILEGRQLEYRVHFAETVDMQEAAEALSAMHWLEESPYALEVETQGHFAYVVFEHDEDDITEFEDWLVEHFLEVHQRFPILEVLHLFIAEADSPWQTWSSEVQWPPDEGPMFGVDWPFD